MELLKPEDVGRLLNISGRTARKLGEAHAIPGAVRIGKQWRFRKDLLMGWIAKQTEPEVSKENELQGVKGD